MRTNWTGVFPAITTQFKDDLSVDLEATLKHVQILLDNGVHGIVLAGTVGEACSMSMQEKVSLVTEVVKHVNGAVPILSGVAECLTSCACEYAVRAEQAGVDGLMVMPPLSYVSDRRETMTYFRAVAEATSAPIMIYNNPKSYRVDILPEEFKDLADLENVVAIKESSEDPRRLIDLRNLYNDRFILFAGVDDLALESIANGAEGWISGLVNAFPAENRMLWDAAMAGDFKTARDIYRWYMPLLHLDTHSKLVQYIKLAVQAVGYGNELTRPPRLALEGEERARILKIIEDGIKNRPVPGENGAVIVPGVNDGQAVAGTK